MRGHPVKTNPARYLVLLIAALLASCSLSAPQTVAAGTRAWFDEPLPGTVALPPNPCHLVAHAASAKGIVLFEVSVNGKVAATLPSPQPGQQLVTLGYDCTDLQPGRNLLRLRAQDGAGQWSGYAETTIVLEAGTATSTEMPATATGTPAARETETFTPTPAATETATFTPAPTDTPTFTAAPTQTPAPTGTPTASPTPQTGQVSIERVSTNLVYIGASVCGPMQVTILARATAPQGIQVVVLFYRFATPGGTTDFQSVAMSASGGDLYQVTLNPSSLLGGAVPFDKATLEYQVVVQQNNGDTSIRTPIKSDIQVQAC
jgi:hypothetical protein